MEASLVAVFVALGHPAAAAASFAVLIRVRDLALGGLGLWPGAGGQSLRLGEADHVSGLAPKPRAMKVVCGGWDQVQRRWMGKERIKSEQEPAAN